MDSFYLKSEYTNLPDIYECSYLRKVTVDNNVAVIVEINNVIQRLINNRYYVFDKLVIYPRVYNVNSIKNYFEVMVKSFSKNELMYCNNTFNSADLIGIGIGEIYLTYNNAINNIRDEENNKMMFKTYFSDMK